MFVIIGFYRPHKKNTILCLVVFDNIVNFLQIEYVSAHGGSMKLFAYYFGLRSAHILDLLDPAGTTRISLGCFVKKSNNVYICVLMWAKDTGAPNRLDAV